MNKEKMTQEQRKQLIEKLRTEYNDWSGRIARLSAFLCDINFVEKVPDIAEQELMEGQRVVKVFTHENEATARFDELKSEHHIL